VALFVLLARTAWARVVPPDLGARTHRLGSFRLGWPSLKLEILLLPLLALLDLLCFLLRLSWLH